MSERIIRGKARFYDINRRSTLAMRAIGKGRAALVKFCAVINKPGPAAKETFTTHVKVIAHEVISQEVAQHEIQMAAREIRGNSGVKKNQAVDVAVSCDSTWARRGIQLLFGMISPIHVETGSPRL